MDSPCLRCTRVRDPERCENKTCKDWQAWFLDCWETLRSEMLAHLNKASGQDAGIPLGGRRYASPHRVRSFLEKDPCEGCLYPAGNCPDPCSNRRQWDRMRKEVRK